MANKRILLISDLGVAGSGYMNISVSLCKGLAELGYEIKCVGLEYRGEPHNYPFSIIPAVTMDEALAILNNTVIMWTPDIVLIAFDIPIQQQIMGRIIQTNLKTNFKFKCVGITALENGPLVDDWAISLSQLDYVFFISELGKQEALKAGLSGIGHLEVGIDSDFWSPLTAEDRHLARKNLGYSDGDFIVLTVADNQERKNLLASFKAIKLAAKEIDHLVHILVTREHNPYGWKLRSLANSLGISDKVFIYERGMPQEQLRLLYGISDVFLLLSRAEGFGMPIIEAMSCGVPCVATNTGALRELLEGNDGSEKRGYLVPAEYDIDLDTWGNSRRTFADTEVAAAALVGLMTDKSLLEEFSRLGREFAKTRTWKNAVDQVDSAIQEISNEVK